MANPKAKPPRRTEPPEVRRNQILEAAKRRFREVGFHGASMAEIAQAAGVSVGLIYRYFPSKEAVIEGIVLEDLGRQLEQLTAVLDAHPADLSAAMDAAEKVVMPMAVDRERTLLMLEIAAEAARNPKIRAFAAAHQVQARALFRSRLMALKPDGVGVEELEVRIQIVAATIQGVAIQLATQDEPPSPLLPAILDSYLRGLMSAGGSV